MIFLVMPSGQLWVSLRQSNQYLQILFHLESGYKIEAVISNTFNCGPFFVSYWLTYLVVVSLTKIFSFGDTFLDTYPILLSLSAWKWSTEKVLLEKMSKHFFLYYIFFFCPNECIYFKSFLLYPLWFKSGTFLCQTCTVLLA